MSNNILVKYQKLINLTTAINIDKLAKNISLGNPDVHYSDNLDYYLKLIEFYDYELLSESQVREIKNKLALILGYE